MIIYPYAKINIGLNVLEKRIDGYHNIDSVFYPVRSYTDILEIKESRSFSFTSSGINLPTGENLCVRAWRLLREDFDVPNVSIFLYKKIPIGSGLGGGSSDAAFTLKALNNIFSLGIELDSLKEYAIRLGSDCPFFLDHTPKVIRGIGDDMTSIRLDLSNYNIRIKYPDIHIATDKAYSLITPSFPLKSIIDIIKLPISDWRAADLKNDFEEVMCDKYPEILKLKKSMYSSGAIYASMTGSGSAVYGIFNK